MFNPALTSWQENLAQACHDMWRRRHAAIIIMAAVALHQMSGWGSLRCLQMIDSAAAASGFDPEEFLGLIAVHFLLFWGVSFYWIHCLLHGGGRIGEILRRFLQASLMFGRLMLAVIGCGTVFFLIVSALLVVSAMLWRGGMLQEEIGQGSRALMLAAGGVTALLLLSRVLALLLMLIAAVDGRSLTLRRAAAMTRDWGWPAAVFFALLLTGKLYAMVKIALGAQNDMESKALLALVSIIVVAASLFAYTFATHIYKLGVDVADSSRGHEAP